jgi:N-acetyl-anhydromuramyl-L-alanine amidase AmpD
MVAGQLVHVGAPVVLWTDPGGYDAYRTERRFVPPDQAPWAGPIEGGPQTPSRFGQRRNLDEATLAATRGGGWTLDQARRAIDQFVIHYDVCGTSRTCFRVLHDQRGLSIHFMLDIDGTIYQTLDVKERAWHATIANDRSVGIEIANIGAYPTPDDPALRQWYALDPTDPDGPVRITIPARLGDGGVRTTNFVGRPARHGPGGAPLTGPIHAQPLHMHDLTDEQYESLIRLTAALHTALPAIRLDYPRNPDGSVRTGALSREEFDCFTGLIGHFHIQTNKSDPGPAFDWERVVRGARQILRSRE